MSTSKCIIPLKTIAGAAVTTGTVELLPYGNTYPTGALALTHDHDGIWYRAAVPDGEYSLYYNGAVCPSYQRFYVSENISSLIARNFTPDGSPGSALNTFASSFPFFVENASLRAAIKNVTVMNAHEGYVYYIGRLYKNNSYVHEQIWIYKKNLSTGVISSTYWCDLIAASHSGVQVVKYSYSDSNEIFYITVDFDQVPDGGDIGYTGVMVIDPINYIYQEYATLITTSLFAQYPLKSTNKPVGSGTMFTLQQTKDFIVDIFLQGIDSAQDYSLKQVRRNYSGGWLLYVYRISDSALVAYWQTSTSPENGNNITVHSLIPFGSSGITGQIAVRWAAIPTGIDFNNMWSDYSFEHKIYDKQNAVIINSIAVNSDVITITVKRYGTSGVDADFCGLNAIGDALASITDASKYKRYRILVDGKFLFTDPSQLIYVDPAMTDEPTVIVGKDYVDIQGISKDRAIVAVMLWSGSTFPSGKHFSDYQPVVWNCNSKLSDITIIGRNCRYAVHFEGWTYVTDKELTFENVDMDYQGAAEFGQTSGACLGTGMRDGQTWNLKNCKLKSIDAAFGMHSPLSAVTKGGIVNFYNCEIDAPQMYFNPYPTGKEIKVNMIDCKLLQPLYFSLRSFYSATSQDSDYSEIKISANMPPVAFNNGQMVGGGLRIKSKSTGSSSNVRFDTSATAFNSIIGDSTSGIQILTDRGTNLYCGYEFRDGGTNLRGYAIGRMDVDEDNTAKSNGLAILLGNCSSVNKILTVIVDGTTYNITFNENYAGKNNAYIIGKITAVIGSVADVDVYCLGLEYFPSFKGNEFRTNVDSTSILSGMGVVYSGSGIRLALNSDNRIDGISLDNIAPTQQGRIITMGQIYSDNFSFLRFHALGVSGSSRSVGDQLGVSSSQPGYFDAAASPKVLRAIATDIVRMI